MAAGVEIFEPRCQLTVERMAAGGDGVAVGPSGERWFVPGGVMGDVLAVSRVEKHKGAKYVREFAVLTPAPARVAPPCDVGGCCPWAHIELGFAAEAKREITRAALRHIAGLNDADVLPTLSARTLGYRHRARLHANGQLLGYEKRASHVVHPFRGCAALAPALSERLAALAALVGKAGGLYGELEALHSPDQERLVVELVAERDRPFEPMFALLREALRQGIVSGATIHAAQQRERRLGEPSVLVRHPSFAGEPPRFFLEPGVFSQANLTLNARLVECVVAAVPAGQTVLELHAGAGNFTVAYAAKSKKVRATERDEQAVMCLRRNLETHAASSSVEAQVVSDLDAVADRAALAPTLLLLDPPRAGAKQTLALVAAEPGALARIVYVSCDPGSLARDLAELSRSFRVTKVQPVDMFPATPHVEIVAVLDRRSPL